MANTKLYPLKFKPIFKERIWGGRNLETYFGKALPGEVKIGESWELADLPGDKSEIVNGPLAGVTINEAIAKYGVELTGSEAVGSPFPLLIKLLDCQDVLSVQVHPDADTCKRTGKGEPKTECWYIIQAQPGAVIYKGLKDGVDKNDVKKAIKKGKAAEVLNKVQVKEGQCHFLPSGTAHAIGAGLLIAEIQQPSDTTYRLFDWNRKDAKTGQPRELHIEDGIESINLAWTQDKLAVQTVGRLVDEKEFKVDKGHQASGCEVLIKKGPVKTIVMLSGSGVIFVDGNDNDVPFTKGDTLLVPAAYEGVIKFEDDCEYLICTV
jgi:mannose-6-phosphate isomerase